MGSIRTTNSCYLKTYKTKILTHSLDPMQWSLVYLAFPSREPYGIFHLVLRPQCD